MSIIVDPITDFLNLNHNAGLDRHGDGRAADPDDLPPSLEHGDRQAVLLAALVQMNEVLSYAAGHFDAGSFDDPEARAVAQVALRYFRQYGKAPLRFALLEEMRVANRAEGRRRTFGLRAVDEAYRVRPWS